MGPKIKPKVINGGKDLGLVLQAHSYSAESTARLSQLAHLDSHLQHLWGRDPGELGFRGGWRHRELRRKEVKEGEEWLWLVAGSQQEV